MRLFAHKIAFMALCAAPLQTIEDVIKRLQSQGCEIRTAIGKLIGPHGEEAEIPFAFNPANQKFVHLDYEPGEYLTLSSIESIERRLEVTLGFPRQPEFDRHIGSAAKH